MIESTPSGVRFAVRVTPRASRNEIVGWDDTGALKVKIQAPPVEGEANAALVAWLAKLIGVRKGAIRIVRGDTGRLKLIAIDGVAAKTLSDVISQAIE